MSKDKKPDALSRATEAEQKIREELNKAGGLGGKALMQLDDFFSNYKDNSWSKPAPDYFPEICKIITGLRLMCLSEHRNGIAGGIAAVAALNPDLVPLWKHIPTVALLIDSAERIAPPLVDNDVTSIGHVEYLWIWWLVTREESTLNRLISLARRTDMVGTMAQDLLAGHTNIRRIREVVEIESRNWKPVVVPVLDLEVKQLAEKLSGDLYVFCIGRQEDGKLVVVTLDGRRPAGCPEDVIVRLPTKEEQRIYQALQDEAEEP